MVGSDDGVGVTAWRVLVSVGFGGVELGTNEIWVTVGCGRLEVSEAGRVLCTNPGCWTAHPMTDNTSPTDAASLRQKRNGLALIPGLHHVQ